MAEVWQCTNEEYHADTTKIGSTMLRTARKSLADYKVKYVDKTKKHVQTKSQLLGSVVHCLLLEPDNFPSLYTFRPDDIDGRTAAGKKALAELAVSSLGKTVITAEMHAQAKRMEAAVLAVPECREYLDRGIKERAITWSQDGLYYKIKPDIVMEYPDEDADLVLDLKTDSDPTPQNWDRGGAFCPMRKYGYDIQMSHYTKGVYAYTSRVSSAGLIVVGSDGEHDVYIYDVTEWLPVGEAARMEAMQIIASAEELGWRMPGQRGVYKLHPSKWDINQE